MVSEFEGICNFSIALFRDASYSAARRLRMVDETQDAIEKQIEIKAPLARVWRAFTHHEEFGAWFRVKLEGPFVAGEVSRGYITWPGYEHLKWEAVVQTMEPEKRF